MSAALVIIGCGGFGREVFSIMRALDRGQDVAGFVDDGPSDADRERVRQLGSSIIGTVDDLAARPTPVDAVVAVGSPTARSSIVARLANTPVRYATLVHPDSTLGSFVTLGSGSVVAPGARLSTNVTIGRHVHIDQNATVGHDSRVDDYARLNPQACVSGSVTVGRRALVGAGATILPGLTIGADAVVGAAACVVRDVASEATVKGVPAR